MIGAEFEMSNGQICQCLIIEHRSRYVKRVRAIKFSPFVTYGYFCETSYSNLGYVRKYHLTNLKSTRIISNKLSEQLVIHNPNITEN